MNDDNRDMNYRYRELEDRISLLEEVILDMNDKLSILMSIGQNKSITDPSEGKVMVKRRTAAQRLRRHLRTKGMYVHIIKNTDKVLLILDYNSYLNSDDIEKVEMAENGTLVPTTFEDLIEDFDILHNDEYLEPRKRRGR